MVCLLHECCMSHTHVWYKSFTSVLWIIHMCDVVHVPVYDVMYTYVCCGSSLCVTWFIHMGGCRVSCIYWPRGSYTRVWFMYDFTSCGCTTLNNSVNNVYIYVHVCDTYINMYMYVSTLTPWKCKCEQVSQVTLSRTEVWQNDDDDCFYYHSWRNDVVIAFGTLSSFCCNNGEMVLSDISVNFLTMLRVLSRGVPPIWVLA